MKAITLPLLLSLLLMQAVTERALTPLLDFAGPAAAEQWQAVNDGVMGGVSDGRFRLTADKTLEFFGTLSLENNGGFASVRSSPVQENLNGTDAFVFRVRGDGRRYKFTVRTGSGFNAPNYQAELMTKRGEWEELRLALKDFVPTFRGRVLTDVPPLNLAKVTSLGFLISDKQ